MKMENYKIKVQILKCTEYAKCMKWGQHILWIRIWYKYILINY